MRIFLYMFIIISLIFALVSCEFYDSEAYDDNLLNVESFDESVVKLSAAEEYNIGINHSYLIENFSILIENFEISYNTTIADFLDNGFYVNSLFMFSDIWIEPIIDGFAIRVDDYMFEREYLYNEVSGFETVRYSIILGYEDYDSFVIITCETDDLEINPFNVSIIELFIYEINDIDINIMGAMTGMTTNEIINMFGVPEMRDTGLNNVDYFIYFSKNNSSEFFVFVFENDGLSGFSWYIYCC